MQELTSSEDLLKRPQCRIFFADNPFTSLQGLRIRKRRDGSIGMSDLRKKEDKEEIKSMADAERGGILVTPGGHD